MNKIFVAVAALIGLGAGGSGMFVIQNTIHKQAMEALIKQHTQAIGSIKIPPTSMIRMAPDFDVTKLNNKKGEFTYAPVSTFTNVTIVVDKSDTTLLNKAKK